MVLPLSAAARSAWQHAQAGVASGAADPYWNGDHI
jgi:hypothetical protein